MKDYQVIAIMAAIIDSSKDSEEKPPLSESVNEAKDIFAISEGKL